jgi:hypothetical protein
MEKKNKVMNVKGGLLGKRKEKERAKEGVKMLKVCYVHVYNYHNESLYFVQLIYTKFF